MAYLFQVLAKLKEEEENTSLDGSQLDLEATLEATLPCKDKNIYKLPCKDKNIYKLPCKDKNIIQVTM